MRQKIIVLLGCSVQALVKHVLALTYNVLRMNAVTDALIGVRANVV